MTHLHPEFWIHLCFKERLQRKSTASGWLNIKTSQSFQQFPKSTQRFKGMGSNCAPCHSCSKTVTAAAPAQKKTVAVSLGNRLGKQEGQKLQIPFASEISNMLIYIFFLSVLYMCPLSSSEWNWRFIDLSTHKQSPRSWARPPSIQ